MRTLEIVHRTRYEYSAPVTLGEHRLMFRPRDSHDLRLLYTGLAIDPAHLGGRIDGQARIEQAQTWLSRGRNIRRCSPSVTGAEYS